MQRCTKRLTAAMKRGQNDHRETANDFECGLNENDSKERCTKRRNNYKETQRNFKETQNNHKGPKATDKNNHKRTTTKRHKATITSVRLAPMQERGRGLVSHLQLMLDIEMKLVPVPDQPNAL